MLFPEQVNSQEGRTEESWSPYSTNSEVSGESSEHGPVPLSHNAYMLYMPGFLGLKNSPEYMGTVHVYEVDGLVS